MHSTGVTRLVLQDCRLNAFTTVLILKSFPTVLPPLIMGLGLMPLIIVLYWLPMDAQLEI